MNQDQITDLDLLILPIAGWRKMHIPDNSVLRIDALVSFKDLVLEGFTNEVQDATQDTGPIDADSPEEIERQYRLFYGTSPLSSPSPSPPPDLHPPPPGLSNNALDAHLPHQPGIDSRSGASTATPPILPGPDLDGFLSERAERTHQPQASQAAADKGTRSLKRLREDPSGSSSTPPLTIPPTAPCDQGPAVCSKTSKQRRNTRKSKRQRRDRRRDERADDIDSTRAPPEFVAEKHILKAEEIPTNYTVEDIPFASTAYIAKPDSRGRVYNLAELLGRGFKLVKWDGRSARPIVDSNGVVVAVLVGRPNDSKWDDLHQHAFRLLEESAGRCDFTSKCSNHRHGKFAALNAGISFGGGQGAPGNLSHTEARAKELEKLLKSKPFGRLAGLASDALKSWMPKLHAYYGKQLQRLLDPALAATFKLETPVTAGL